MSNNLASVDWKTWIWIDDFVTYTIVGCTQDAPIYEGFTTGEYIPFETADEVFSRARAIGARVLLRLHLTEKQELRGIFYTNDQSLSN